MLRLPSTFAALGIGLLFVAPASFAQENTKKARDASAPGKSVEKIAEEARKSVVVIVFAGRDGKQQGLGTGFIVSADGLIATNLHVIGQARPITVVLHDGTRHEVTSVHASDRTFDLALVKIDAKNLAPLSLGDAKGLKQGQPIVALGHPRGLEYSVVAGVLSGQRDIDGMTMLQVAMPIEQGNSGGPVLDMQGRVQGIVTMKSLVTANLGFAVPASALKPLLAKPNPIPMEHWLTIGTLDKAEWKTLYGGRWRQRAGRIISDGFGSGFGGRTLCLSQQNVPKGSYEIGVTVKLEDEAGAAGIIFGGDGGDKHFGFYPSAGRLRFTLFNGADVFSWKVIKEFPSEHYKKGEWNAIKVRVDKDKVSCYVNEHMVLETTVDTFPGDVVGLAKFREPSAEFKHFQIAERIASTKLAPQTMDRITKVIDGLPWDKPYKLQDVDKFLPEAAVSIDILRERARILEQQAAQMKKLAAEVHHQRTLLELAKATGGPDAKIDLAHAALLIARLDNEELDVDLYRKEIDRLAREVQSKLAKNADAKTKVDALNNFLFKERGFHGSRVEYYTRANSYLNEVIDDREGLPITLSVLYMEIGRKLGLNLVGVALPAHFMVRHEPKGGQPQYVDVFEGGAILTEDEATQKIIKLTGKTPDKKHYAAAAKSAIATRMLHNLLTVAQDENDLRGMLRYADALLTINPSAGEERWLRAVLRFQTGLKDDALKDVDWLLEHNPPNVDLTRVQELRRLLVRPEK